MKHRQIVTCLALLLALAVPAACVPMLPDAAMAGATPSPAARTTAAAASRMSPPTPAEPAALLPPAQTAGASATPDIPATVVALQQPRRHASYTSPDEKWRAEMVTYDCVRTGEGQENAYEQLVLVETAGGVAKTVDSQLQNCGGLGAFGLEGLFWSPNSRYFYYADAREGSPDGCGYWERPIIRLDVASLDKSRLGAGPLSPTGEHLATWQGQELVIWDIDGGEAGRLPAMARDAQAGPIAWAPDGQSLVYLQVGSFCPLSGKSYLVRVDLSGLTQTLLLESAAPTFGSVKWETARQLRLVDAHGKEWQYDVESHGLTNGQGIAGTPSP